MLLGYASMAIALMLGFASHHATAAQATPPAGCSTATPTLCLTKSATAAYQEGYTLIDSLLGGFYEADMPFISSGGKGGSFLVDRTGNIVKSWSISGYSKLQPNGHLLAGYNFPAKIGKNQLYLDCLVETAWNGSVVWPPHGNLITASDGSTRCDPTKQVASLLPDGTTAIHHEFQREGNPVGYYVPGQTPKRAGGKTLILGNTFPPLNRNIDSSHPLFNDRIYEVEFTGNKQLVHFTWDPVDHFTPRADHPGDLGLGFTPGEMNTIVNLSQIAPFDFDSNHANLDDWLHSNAVSYVGPNKWCPNPRNAATCDARFHPENIIWNSREANVIAIIARRDGSGWLSGDIVWRLGPDNFPDVPGKVGQLVGEHSPHIIPAGLPGAGNMLVFDNGSVPGNGGSGYGDNGATSIHKRDFNSRVIEFDPTTLDVVWLYERPGTTVRPGESFAPFSSPFVSNAQRLPNGNTLISEGFTGRAFEVTTYLPNGTVDTSAGTLVWEWVNPYRGFTLFGAPNNGFYRAYRVPKDWVPGTPGTP